MRPRRFLSAPLALTALLLPADTIPRTRAVDRATAVTFDDLPAIPAGVVANDVASLEELARKLPIPRAAAADERWTVQQVGSDAVSRPIPRC